VSMQKCAGSSIENEKTLNLHHKSIHCKEEEKGSGGERGKRIGVGAAPSSERGAERKGGKTAGVGRVKNRSMIALESSREKREGGGRKGTAGGEH